MNNIMEYEAISEKIKCLESELDTFIRTIHELKEIRNSVGSLPADLEERKNEIENLISSGYDQLADFEKQANSVISDIEKKADALSREANAIKGADPNNGSKQLEIHKKVMNRKIKKIEENFYTTLTRQKYAIVILSGLFITGMSFFTYMFFIR